MNTVRKLIGSEIHRNHEFFREDFAHRRGWNAIAYDVSSFQTILSVIIDNLHIKEVVVFDLKANPVLIIDPNAVLFLPVSLSLRGYRFFFAECARTPTRVIPARPNRIKNSHSAGADRSPVGGSAFLTVKGAEASPSS